MHTVVAESFLQSLQWRQAAPQPHLQALCGREQRSAASRHVRIVGGQVQRALRQVAGNWRSQGQHGAARQCPGLGRAAELLYLKSRPTVPRESTRMQLRTEAQGAALTGFRDTKKLARATAVGEPRWAFCMGIKPEDAGRAGRESAARPWLIWVAMDTDLLEVL